MDGFGRAHAAAYLRHLAQVAIDASGAAGFDAAWYAAAGARWLVRRTTLAVRRPARADSELEVRTWVEDFRRVRSRRRYEAYPLGARDEAVSLSALTDWVFVDLATGRPRRVPAEMQARFGVAVDGGAARPAWDGGAPPVLPARTTHRVRWAEVDGLGHMNNAAYLDLLVESAFEALAAAGWPLERLASAAAPYVAACDIEYLDEVRYADDLETATWFGAAPHGLDVHQRAVRLADGRPVVQANTRWLWADPQTDAPAPPPAGLVLSLGACGRAAVMT